MAHTCRQHKFANVDQNALMYLLPNYSVKQLDKKCNSAHLLGMMAAGLCMYGLSDAYSWLDIAHSSIRYNQHLLTLPTQ